MSFFKTFIDVVDNKAIICLVDLVMIVLVNLHSHITTPAYLILCNLMTLLLKYADAVYI
jgi:hypothetical protein